MKSYDVNYTAAEVRAARAARDARIAELWRLFWGEDGSAGCRDWEDGLVAYERFIVADWREKYDPPVVCFYEGLAASAGKAVQSWA